MIQRHLMTRLLAALADTPVVFLAGARQTGKSTLARAIASGPHRARYLSLDDATELAAADADPQGFVAGLEGSVVIDEVQRVPQLLLAIKAAVDQDRRPGRFLLTGSADVLAMPRVAETLAGRMEVHTLWPLSRGELAGVREGFIDALFSDRELVTPTEDCPRNQLVERVACGGYPEVHLRARSNRREAWFRSYLAAVLAREVRDLANIEGLSQLPQVLALVAARSGGLASYADLARTVQIPQTTIKRYLALLEATLLVHRVPAWYASPSARLAKAPKLFLCDSGLACHLLGIDARRLESDPFLLGGLVESYVVGEIARQLGWSEVRPRLSHLRAHNGREVDLVLEGWDGRLVGIEIKAGASVSPRDLSGLRALAKLAGSRFVRGVVLYTGATVVPFAPDIHAVPMSALWSPTNGGEGR